MTIAKLLSLIIAIAYIAITWAAVDSESAMKLGLYLLLPLACIWFSEAMGDYTGILSSGSITQSSPGCAVAAGGWLLLFLPVIMGIVSTLMADDTPLD